MSRTVKHKLTGAKSVSSHCGNHGDCPYCESNRRYNEFRDVEKMRDYVKDMNKADTCRFKVGQVVEFVLDNTIYEGTIKVVDVDNFFDDEPSYDIVVENRNTLHQNVPESAIIG